eukprot:TRINITY_DN2991_c0_g1_i3.p1 TRINITY_DN2991_c0_g1~~TRINITY_DN2991_c0_g1_i3.p1  ORF type:complete len:108 (+),score=6.47 TRINITY_DN2991_c0_g1_i3:124-447(+)
MYLSDEVADKVVIAIIHAIVHVIPEIHSNRIGRLKNLMIPQRWKIQQITSRNSHADWTQMLVFRMRFQVRLVWIECNPWHLRLLQFAAKKRKSESVHFLKIRQFMDK